MLKRFKYSERGFSVEVLLIKFQDQQIRTISRRISITATKLGHKSWQQLQE